MGADSIRRAGADEFADVVDALKKAHIRDEVVLTEVPAPRRLAPFGVAFSAEVLHPKHPDDAIGAGRFVLLYDPEGQDAWGGTWRVVTFARAELDAEMAADPILGAIGWTWLKESLTAQDAGYTAEAGTVTRVVNESFGGMRDRPIAVELEVRASWTPTDDDIVNHLQAWVTLMCTVAGMPPLPEGVIALPSLF